MAKALGLGGIFFTCENADSLALWYEKWLGFKLDAGHVSIFNPNDMPVGSYTIWGPFKMDSNYFQPSTKPFMINIVVDDLEGALAQVKEGGADVIDSIEDHDYGRFGWFIDPEGNKVELWEPLLNH